MDQNELRRSVNRRRGTRVNDLAWRLLAADGYLEDILEEAAALPEIADESEEDAFDVLVGDVCERLEVVESVIAESPTAPPGRGRQKPKRARSAADRIVARETIKIIETGSDDDAPTQAPPDFTLTYDERGHLARIGIDAPGHIPAKEVARLRARLWDVLGQSDRAVDRKTADLAIFVAMASKDQLSWPSARRTWAQQFPEHQKGDQRHFARDARAAYKHVTGEPLRWHRPPVSDSERALWLAEGLLAAQLSERHRPADELEKIGRELEGVRQRIEDGDRERAEAARTDR